MTASTEPEGEIHVEMNTHLHTCIRTHIYEQLVKEQEAAGPLEIDAIRDRMPLLHSCISEALRMYPPLILLMRAVRHFACMPVSLAVCNLPFAGLHECCCKLPARINLSMQVRFRAKHPVTV